MNVQIPVLHYMESHTTDNPPQSIWRMIGSSSRSVRLRAVRTHLVLAMVALHYPTPASVFTVRQRTLQRQSEMRWRRALTRLPRLRRASFTNTAVRYSRITMDCPEFRIRSAEVSLQFRLESRHCTQKQNIAPCKPCFEFLRHCI